MDIARTTTGPEGCFRFSNISPGAVDLIVSAVGYHAQTIHSVLVVDQRIGVVNVRLAQPAIMLDGVHIDTSPR